MCAKSNEKTKRQSTVHTLEVKLKIIADFETGKQAVTIRHEYEIPPITVADYS
jgi:hypothetical protein